MSNKLFCQGPTCHEQVTTDRFLKSRGVIRGRYAYFDRDVEEHYYGTRSDKYFCSQRCKFEWLSEHMEDIEHGRPIVFIRHRRETQGYHRVNNEERWGGQYRIERVDNRTELDQDNPINKERYNMTKTIKAEYLPGGAKRQELLDQVPEYLLKPGADQGTKHMFCIEMLKLTETEYLEALNKATNGGVVESAWN